jgi:hypothetical protein
VMDEVSGPITAVSTKSIEASRRTHSVATQLKPQPYA